MVHTTWSTPQRTRDTEAIDLGPMNAKSQAIARPLALSGATGLALSLLSALPAGAHGLADGTLLSGAAHPLLGLDHLLLLVGVGAVGAWAGAGVLVFALAGGVIGALLGSAGGTLPGAELLAALAVSGLGILILQTRRAQQKPSLAMAGTIVAAAVAVHALLHGQEAAAHWSWWSGAVVASAGVVGVSFATLRSLEPRWTLRLAAALGLAGGALALAPLG